MSGPLLVFVLGMAVCSILMVLAMVPFSLELLSPSADMAQHRQRVRSLGAIGVFTEKLIPHFFDAVGPKRFWGAVYAVTWICILYFIAYVVMFSEGGASAHNLWMVVLVVGGWFAVHGLIVGFGRAIERANRRSMQAAQARGAAVGSAMADEKEDEASDPEPTEMAGLSREKDRGSLLPHVAATSCRGPHTSDGSEQEPTLGQRIKGAVWMISAIFVVLVVTAIGSQIPSIQRLEQFIAERHAAFLGLTIGLTAIGFVMFMGGIIHLMLAGGRPMESAEAQAAAARNFMTQRPALWRVRRYRFKGEAVGREGEEAFSLFDMKAAWGSGLWWRDPVWRRRFIIVGGVFTMLIGGFGIVFVQGPPGIKLLAAGAVLYALIRTAWAFFRARPEMTGGDSDGTA